MTFLRNLFLDLILILLHLILIPSVIFFFNLDRYLSFLFN